MPETKATQEFYLVTIVLHWMFEVEHTSTENMIYDLIFYSCEIIIKLKLFTIGEKMWKCGFLSNQNEKNDLHFDWVFFRFYYNMNSDKHFLLKEKKNGQVPKNTKILFNQISQFVSISFKYSNTLI